MVLAARYGEGSFSVSNIAKKEEISVPYLEQILNALKQKGLVKSVRGPQGGYALAEKPSDISLERLFHALEGRRDPATEVVDKSSEDLGEISVANALFWKKFETSLHNGLSKITLKDLVDEARRLKKAGRVPAPTFHI